MSRIGKLILLTVCVVRGLSIGTANADDLDPISQKFHFDLGVFLLNTDTTVRVDGSGGTLGSNIDLKRDFGFDHQDRFRVDGYWRFFNRHKLRFMYFDSSVTSDRTLGRDIHFGDVTFPIAAAAHASNDTQILELAYEYSLYKSSNLEFAGTLGLHNLRIDTKLSATTSSALGGTTRNLQASAEGNGPLPVIGVRAIWALSNQFYFDGVAQFFAAKVDEYDGNLQDYKLDAIWQPFKNFGVGLGYNQFVSNLDVSKDRFNGKLKFKYGGPLLFATVAF